MDGAVLVIVDQIRASTMLTTLLDLGVTDLRVTGSVAAARRLARETGSLLAGEHLAASPAGSTSTATHRDQRGGPRRPRHRPLHDQRDRDPRPGQGRSACADRLPPERPGVRRGGAGVAGPTGRVQVICAGRGRRFVLEDAVAAGAIADHIVELAGRDVACRSDAADAASRLRASYPDALTAMAESGRRRDAPPDLPGRGHRVLRRRGRERDGARPAGGRTDADRSPRGARRFVTGARGSAPAPGRRPAGCPRRAAPAAPVRLVPRRAPAAPADAVNATRTRPRHRAAWRVVGWPRRFCAPASRAGVDVREAPQP